MSFEEWKQKVLGRAQELLKEQGFDARVTLDDKELEDAFYRKESVEDTAQTVAVESSLWNGD